MAVSTGLIGHGTTITLDATPIGEVFNISGPSIEVDDVEFTHHDSPDAYKEWKAGLADGGEVELELNYTKAQKTTLMANVRTSADFVITYPDNSTDSFTGYIKALGQETPTADKITNTVTIKVTSVPQFSAS